ncbi:MAG: condensation domain-containing protein, partial [Bacteroidota bacterium]
MESLIKKLRTNQVFLSVNGDQLDVHFDGATLAPELIQELKTHKQALIEYIQAKTTQKDYQPIPVLPPQESYPLSSSQHRSWLLSQFEEANPAYNMPVSFIFQGALDRSILERTFDTLIDRHEILRTVFKDDEHGEIRQYIKERANLGFQIVYEDLAQVSNQDQKVEPIILREITQPFDLYHGPLIRARLIRLAPDRHLFSYVMHHIVGDAMSGDLLQQEIALLYQAFAQEAPNPLPPLRIQYKDYAAWQQAELNSEQQQKEEAYWLKQFTGELPVLQMATDLPRPAVKTYNGTRLYQIIPQDRIRGLKRIVEQAGCTLYMGLLGLVNTLLHRYSGQTDIILGSPISGRNHTDLKTQIGFYINTLALRTQFDAHDSFNDLLANIKQTTIGAYEHQMYSFDELVNQLNLKRDLSRNPL